VTVSFTIDVYREKARKSRQLSALFWRLNKMLFGLRGILFRLGHINSRSIWLCGQKVLRKPIEKETFGAKIFKKQRF